MKKNRIFTASAMAWLDNSERVRVVRELIERPGTIRQISFRAGLPRENVCRYVAEMRKLGRLYPMGRVKCTISGEFAMQYTMNKQQAIAAIIRATMPIWEPLSSDGQLLMISAIKAYMNDQHGRCADSLPLGLVEMWETQVKPTITAIMV